MRLTDFGIWAVSIRFLCRLSFAKEETFPEVERCNLQINVRAGKSRVRAELTSVANSWTSNRVGCTDKTPWDAIGPHRYTLFIY